MASGPRGDPKRTQQRVMRGDGGVLYASEQKAPRVPRDSHSVPDQVRVGGGARWAPGGREGRRGNLGSVGGESGSGRVTRVSRKRKSGSSGRVCFGAFGQQRLKDGCVEDSGDESKVSGGPR